MTIELRANGAANNNPREIATRGNLEPQSFAEVAKLAEYVARSGLFAVKTPEQAMVVMLTGASLGLSPVAALRGVHVIQGKATLDATLVSALVQNHPDCEYWRVTENTNERCTIITKRRSHTESVSRTWTIDDAKRAGLTGKDTWKSYPAAMLRARCVTDLGRAVYGDALFGVYTPEELEPTREAYEAPREAATPRPAVSVVETRPTDHVAVEDLLAKIAQAQTADALKAVAQSIGKGHPDRKRLVEAYQARMREIEGGDGPNGGGTPKPEASSQTEARGSGEPVTGEHEPAPQAWTAETWAAHVAQHTKHFAVANSYAKHEAELDACGVHDAHVIAANRLVALGLDDVHATEALNTACDRRDGKKSAGKAA